MRLARLRASGGQASVELLGGLPGLLLLGLVICQCLAVGYSAVLAGAAAEAGALALAGGADARAAARDAVPGAWRDDLAVDVAGGRVRAALRPPGVLALVPRELRVRASAVVEEP